MPRLLPVLTLLSVLSCACDPAPVSYPPPTQRPPITELFVPTRAGMVVNMNDDDASDHFVRDIGAKLEGGSWRWTQKRPAVKILLSKTHGLKFVSDFTVWEGTLAQTGPVTISFFIDERLIDKTRYDSPGYKHIAKPVPPEWLQTSTDTIVAAEIDKLYKDPGDGVTLGFILSRIGFERE